MFKTFVLIWAIMSSPTDQPNWQVLEKDLTAKQCGAHIKSLYDKTYFKHFDKESKVVLFKLNNGETLLLTCFDTARKLNVNIK